MKSKNGIYPGTIVILYLRVSTSKQQADGCSLAIQHANLEQFASAHSLHVWRVISFTGSAFQEPVRNFEELSALLLRHSFVRGVLVASFDRVSRNLDSAQSFLQKHPSVFVYSLREAVSTLSPRGQSVFRTAILQAQLESQSLSDRMKEVIAYHKAQGKPWGRPPKQTTDFDHRPAAADDNAIDDEAVNEDLYQRRRENSSFRRPRFASGYMLVFGCAFIAFFLGWGAKGFF